MDAILRSVTNILKDNRQRGGGRDLAGRGLDEVPAGEHRQPGRATHVVVGDELAGLEDHLQVRRTTGLLDGDDLVEHLR